MEERGRHATISGTEVAASMAATLGQCLRKHGIEGGRSDEIALDVLQEVRLTYGGQNIYFPREQKKDISERDAEIYDRFMSNELSVPEIAQEYGHSLQWAYSIIRKVRAKRKEEREAEREAQHAKEHARWKRES
jgi:Mor family transcriptional regulator